jgi:hypothetical protein
MQVICCNEEAVEVEFGHWEKTSDEYGLKYNTNRNTVV